METLGYQANNKSSGLFRLRILLSIILGLLSLNSVLGQSYLIPVNAATNKYPITFTDEAQQTLIIEFDRAVTSGGTSAGWAITVGGVPVAMVGNPTPSGNYLRIVLASSISYADRNSVLVSYNSGAGSMSLTGGLEPDFTGVQAVNNYIAVASDFTNGLYGEIAPIDICAPVVDVQVESNIVMSRRYRNSIHYSLPKIWVLWEYPNPFPRTLGFYTEVGGVGSGNFRSVEPYAGYPDNTDNCTWDVAIYPYLYNTGTLQPNLYITVNQVVMQLPNYKRDDGTPEPGTGELEIDPPVDHPRTLFCVGDDITAFIFEDETVFDCQLPVEPDLPNIYTRYVQYVYGTHTGAGIPNVFIDVNGTMVQVTDNNGDPISGTWYVNPDGSPNPGGYTTPSGFFEGPVIKYEWDFFTRLLITPMAQTYPIYHAGDFINDQAGDIFDVTLRNWGPCNAYDAGNPFTYLDAVTEFSRLRLIESPPLPTAPDVFTCSGGSTTLTAVRNGAPNPGMLHWYDDAALTHEVETGDTYTPSVSAPGTYTYYVREISGNTGNCPGPAEDVVLTINPVPNTPTVTRTGADFCYDGLQSVTLTANPNTPPAVTSYQWYRNGGVIAGATTGTIVLNDVAESGEYTVRTFGVAPTFCPSELSAPVDVVIEEPATVNAGSDQTICSSMTAAISGTRGGSAISTTWTTSGTGTFGNASNLSTTYTPGAADITAGTVTLTITTNNPAGPCPAVSDFLVLTIVTGPQVNAGADDAICQGTPYTVGDATASGYVTLNWTENGAGTITAGQGTLSPTYTPGAAEANATVTLTLTATGTVPCANVTDTKILYVDRNPVATVGPVQEICNNTSANLSGNAPASGTTGEWTFINNLVWQETFAGSPQYATSGADWTTSGITPDADTYFRIESGRMVGRDLDAEAVWRSDPIPIASVSPVNVSVYLQETGSLENADYIRVYYSINGGAEVLFTTNGNNTNDFGNRTASVTNLSGNDLRIIIRCRNDANDEYYYFDNIIIRQVSAVAEPVITTVNSATSAVTGLWQGDNRFRWSVFSTHNGCDSASAVYTIRRDISPAAASAGPAQTFCETGSTVMAANAATNGGTGTWSLVSGSGTVTELNNPLSAVTGLGYGANTFRWTITSALGICPATSATVTLTRNPDPLDLSGNVTIVKNPVCYNQPGQIRITGTEADVKYYLRTGGADGSFVQGNGGTITLTTPNLISATTYQIHAVRDVTGCNIIFGSYTINVNPAFTLAQLYSSHNVCAGATTTISVVLTGGTGPFTIVWNDGSDHIINNYVSGTNITAGPYPAGTTTISLTSVQDNNLCVPASLGTPIVITVGSTPTAATLTGSGDLCVGATSSLTFTVTDGVPPYDLIINGTSYSDRNSGSSIPLGALPVGSYTYNLTSVIDACGNPVPPAGLPAPYSFSINEIPSAAATGNNAPVICSNGVTDINLQSTIPGSTFTWTVSNTPAVTWIAGKAPAAGSGVTGTVIAQNLQHTGSSPVTVTYTITPAGPASTFCPGSAVTRTVVVNPTAELNDPADQVRCNGTATAAVSFTTNRTGGTTTYSWTNSTTSIGLAAGGNGNIPSFTAVNTGTSPVTATVTITPSFEGCTGTPQTFTITVNPSGQVNDPSDQVRCNGAATAAVNFSTNRTGGTTTYSWTNSTTSIGLGAGGNGNIPSFTAVNTGTSPVTATITVTPSFEGCAGTPQSFTITVNPSGQVNDPADQTLCNGAATAAVNFGTNRTGGTTTYSWTNSTTSIGLAAGGNGNIPSFTATNTGTAPVTATITVTPSFEGCTGTPQSFTITVNPSGQVNDPSDQVRCNGAATAAVNFSTNRTGGTTTYSWTNSTTSIGLGAGGNGNIPSFTAVNTGTSPVTATVTVTPSFEGCAGTPQSFTITVNPSGQVNDPADQTLCNGAATVAVNFGTNRTGGTTTYSWTNSTTSIGLAAGGNGNIPSFTATNTGTAPVTATITVTPSFEGCAGTSQTFTITVNPTPALNSTLTPAGVCSNTLFTYAPTSLTTGTTFSWTRLAAAGITPAGPVTGTDGVSETLRNFTSAAVAVTYEYVLTANGCTNTQNVIVNISPEPVISDQSASVCSGESLVHQILLDNFVNPGDNVTFTWPAPVMTGGLTGGTARTLPSSADMTDTFVNTSGLAETATYTVTPVYNGCPGAPETIVVTVGSQPVLGNLNRFACSAVTTGLVLAVAPTSSPATTYDIASITVQSGLVAAAGNATATNGVADVNYLANDRFTNETGTDKTVTYRVRPVFGATCIGDWVDVVVTVRPQPVIVPGQVQTVCSNVAASREILLVPANSPAGSTFSWPMPVMSDGSVQGTAGAAVSADPAGTAHIADVLENYGVNPITATYTVTPSSSFGCAGNPVPVVITVNPEPAAPAITGDDILCTSETNVIYTVPLHPGSSYAWSVPASVGTKIFDASSNAIIITAAAVAGSGTITVTETNSYGCISPAGSYDVDVMAPPVQSDITGDNTVCALETGVYSVPGHAGSVYTWTLPTGAALTGDPSAASITVTFGTVSGNLSVREVNAAGCITNHNPLAVTVRPLPTAIISNSGTVCVEDTHPVTFTLTGTAPWTVVYAINGANQPAVNITASPYTLNASAAGNYTITSVTDANGCTNTGIGNATVSYWPVPSATISGTTAICAGKSAVITIGLTGIAPYTFTYTDGGTPVTVTNHPANIYTFTVTPAAAVTYTLLSMEDSHGCNGTLSGTATVTINAQPVLAFAVTDLQCNGDNSGAVNLTVTGSASNSFAWLGPDGFTAGTEDISGVKAGLYNVTVTSGDGCVASGQATVFQPTVLTLSSTGNMELLCNGDPTGAGSFTAAGGTAPYAFTTLVNTSGATLTPSAASVAVTDAGGGSVTVRVTDAHSCTAEASIIVTEPPALNLTSSVTNVSCYGGNNGTIITSVTGGTAPYIYAWTASSGGSGITAGAPNQGGLTAGTYDVTVTDSHGCQVTGTWTITQPTELAVTATAGDNLIGTCSSAQLQATVTGGVQPAGGYIYSWSPAAGLSSTSISNPVAAPASTTTYSVTVTDANGCIRTGSVTINVAPVLTAVAFADDNLIGACPGSETQLHVNVNGGEAPYSFSWMPVGGLSDPAEREPVAAPAATTSYTVTVTDANGCTAAASVTVSVAPPPDVTAAVDDNLIGTCPASVAHLSATATGGEGAYTYLWDNAGTLSSATSAMPTAKPAVTTTYTVTVTDANGCTDQATVTVNVAPDPAVTAGADDTFIGTCPASKSNLSATVTGGEAGYSFSWTPATGLNSTAVSNPVAKPAVTTTYTVTVTDANGCQATDDVTITVAPDLSVAATADDYVLSTCPTSVAQITATAAGGEELAGGGYIWSWAPSAGLSATNIPNPVAKPASTTTYTVTVTDANGCTAINTVTIEVRPPMAAVATATDYLIGDCPASTTTLDVNVTGGELPYVYSWAPAASLNDATAKSPVAKPSSGTTYTVTVTDANGCSVAATVTINIAPPLTATAAVDDDPIGACPSSVARLSTTVSGGEGGYTYLWDNAGTLDDATKANPVAKPAVSTLYTVTVTDANGCTTTAQVQVNVAPDLTVTATADDDIIGSCPSSVANLNAAGAGGELLLSSDYTYNWVPAAGLNYTNVKSPIARPAVTTTYTVTITDRNDCTASDQVTVTVMPPISLTTTPVVYAGGYNITCNGASDGAIDLGVTGGEAPYAYAWSGPSGYTSALQDISGLRAGTYNVTVTDANNCTAATTVILLEPAVLTLGRTPDVVLACFGDATATGSFSVSGGTSPYVLSTLSNTSGASVTITGTSLSFTGGAAGEVTALVTDANGCTAQATITVTQPLQLTPGSVNGDQEVCYSGNPVPLNEVTAPAGGPATILFQWEQSLNGGATWGDVPGATTASYDPPAGILQTTRFRRRVNSAACDPEYSNTVVVTVNPLPVASITGTGFVCPGDAATVTVTITTGESPFTVVLSDGTTVSNYISGSPITVNPAVTTTYTITSVTDNNGCAVSAPHANLTGSATIDVKTVPVISVQPVSQAVCEDEVTTFVAGAGGTTNPHYQWYVDSGSGMTLMPAETAAILSVTATSAMNGYRYQAEISGDCPVPVMTDIVTLTVNNKPEIIIQPVAVALCSGEDAIFTVDAGVTTNPVYQWYVNAGPGWTPATGARYQGANTATLTVVSALEMMSGYQYRVRVSGTCTPFVESDPVTLTVTRQAEITQHPASLTLCEGAAATFTVNAGLTTNPSYLWERSLDGGMTWTPITGQTASSYTIPAVATADNNTAYRAIVSSSCGSGVTSMPAFLTVNELPEITDQPDDVVICEYAIADFTVEAGVTTGATYRWQRSADGGATWNNLTETATYFGVSTMNLKVNGTNRMMSGDMFRVIVSGACTPPVTSSAALLSVNTAPEILAQPVASTICENTNTSFTVTAQGTALTYSWYVDTGSGFSPITDGGVYSGSATNILTLTGVPRTWDNYRYRVEVEGGCLPKAISQTVQLDVSVVKVINTQPANTAICEFMTASFNALADGANLSYQWQAFDGTTWVDLTNSGIYMGAQTPTLMVFGPSRTMDGTRYRVVVSGDCSADLVSDEAVLTVYTAPELSDHPDEFRGCPGGSAAFSVTATGTTLAYQWQVNSGAGFVNVTDDATYSGTSTHTLTVNNLALSMNGYLIRVVVSGTCLPPVTSSFAPLRVYAEPSVISEPADAEVCDLAGASFFSQVFNTGAGETTVWQVNQGSGWNSLSDGALYQGTQTPQLVIMSATTAMNGWRYRLEITGPCNNYYTREALLTVNAWPTAQIAAVDTLLVCGGVPTQLHGNPAGGSGVYTAHRWYGDIGPLNQYSVENPVFNTSMAGYYRLVYQVTDSKGCVGLDTLVIEVEKPVAMFTADALSGCQPLTVAFTNGSTGYTSLLWDFGDSGTSTDINPVHTYTNTGSSLDYHTVRLEITSASGCVSSMENSITVYPDQASDFVISDDTICSGESIMFSTLPGALVYSWTYGDGNNENGSNVTSHIYHNSTTGPVTYSVTLRAESFFGCISETTMPVVVYPTPVPAFIAAPASQVFPAATVTFTNSTNAGTWSWLWNFDDGNTSADMSPVHTYTAPGDFDVSLTVSNGVCSDDVVHTVRVLPAPATADFDSIPSGCQPWNVAINNTSLYATSYYWDFGDGHTSNAMNPNYTYVQAGTYLITLTVTGPGGTDTESQIVHVYPSPRAYFDVSPVKVYVNDEEVRLFNLSEGGDSFIWEFGDGDTSHLRDPFHKYTTEGIYDITLHAYSANGCYDTYTKSPGVTVEPFGDLIFATVFKPNLDGPIEIDELPNSGEAMDQFFFPPIRETVLEYHLQIFNRWGTLIFETFDINKPWNGYFKGKLCQQGVYVWLAEGKYANGRPFRKAGDITLLH